MFFTQDVPARGTKFLEIIDALYKYVLNRFQKNSSEQRIKDGNDSGFS